MKNYLKLLSIILIPLLLSSCSVVTGIFNTGIGFGVFTVVAVTTTIVFFVMCTGKNKS